MLHQMTSQLVAPPSRSEREVAPYSVDNPFREAPEAEIDTELFWKINVPIKSK